jgi:hypothetical protein
MMNIHFYSFFSRRIVVDLFSRVAIGLTRRFVVSFNMFHESLDSRRRTSVRVCRQLHDAKRVQTNSERAEVDFIIVLFSFDRNKNKLNTNKKMLSGKTKLD